MKHCVLAFTLFIAGNLFAQPEPDDIKERAKKEMESVAKEIKILSEFSSCLEKVDDRSKMEKCRLIRQKIRLLHGSRKKEHQARRESHDKKRLVEITQRCKQQQHKSKRHVDVDACIKKRVEENEKRRKEHHAEMEQKFNKKD
jgi:hypothetical protein